MPKRRSDEDDSEDLSVPLPIQTFFWRQTSPFIRPKLGRLQDAACMEQREACKSFEKVLVQNIQFGLSPSLTEAIKSISRWRLVQAALPHVMHCCAALLYARKDGSCDKLGAAETKLLYTLHWILMDAAEECADAEYDQGMIHPSTHYLFPITAVQVFVYLFAPLCYFLKQSDFLASFRLENGLKIWEPLWEHRHPDIPCFTAHVRPKRTILRAARKDRHSQTKFGDVFLGERRAPQEVLSAGSSEGSPAPATGVLTSPVSARESGETESEKSLPKDADHRELKTDTSVCFSTPSKAYDDSSSASCNCPPYKQDGPQQQLDDKDDKSKRTTSTQCKTFHDVTMASYLDVAVLRCLFISQWREEGIYWSLQFLCNRLHDIVEVNSHEQQPRKRSSSLPIPKIEISLYQSPEQKRKEVFFGEESVQNFFMESNYSTTSIHASMQELRRSSFSGSSCDIKPKQKRIKIGDFRTFVEGKLRLSERLLDKIGRDDVQYPGMGERSMMPVDDSSIGIRSRADGDQPPRPKSALALLDHKRPKCEEMSPLLKGEMVRGKSMPSLHLNSTYEKITLDPAPKAGGNLAIPQLTKKIPAYHTHSVPNPIITVTEHSPVSSVQFFLNQDSNDSPKEDSPQTPYFPPCNQFIITRSQTDSNITYCVDDNTEVSGSTHYITSDGHLSFLVVLKAVHAVTLRDNTCSLRVCEVILNLLELLLSMGVLPQPSLEKEADSGSNNERSVDPGMATPATASTPGTEGNKRCQSEKAGDQKQEKMKEELSIHHMFMDTLMRVYKHLGCPHGCGEGHRSPAADVLRSQLQDTLFFLSQADETHFRTFLRDMAMHWPLSEILDIFHAFVGFCSEPGTLVSPVGQKRPAGTNAQNSGAQTGYATNFGAGSGCIRGKGIEGAVMLVIFKPLVTRLMQMQKDLKSQENMALYCDIRQLISYIRDNHGGVFRRVALSGLLDSADRPHKKGKQTTTRRIVRHSKSVDPDEYRDVAYSPTVFVVDETSAEKSSRKSFFRRRGVRKAPSTQSIIDEDLSALHSPALAHSTPSLPRQHKAVTPRLSMSDEEAVSIAAMPKHKGSKFHIVNWLKGDHLKHDQRFFDDDGSCSPIPPDSCPGTDRLSRRASIITNRTPKLGPKSSSHMSLTLLKARKRMEDHLNKFGFGRNKNKHGSFEEPLDISRRNSYDFEHGHREGELLVVKESKLVNCLAVRDGMLRLSFLLEACQPGTLPDPPLLAAILDIKAPVVARAAFYLECAHFVHKCNKGHWPTWMKLNLPVFRPSGPLANRGTPSGLRRTHILHRAAGRLFCQWAEAIGARLEEILQLEHPDPSDIVLATSDESKRRQLRIEDDEEDFLDEASVNPGGSSCPFALKMAACQLLLEITAFLRETYQYLPQKTSRLSTREKQSFEPRSITANRRWSMALSGLGFSQTSAHSLVSLADQTHPAAAPGERRISFVLHEADGEGESENSSNTTLTIPGEEIAVAEDKRGRRIAQGRPHLLRRTAGSSQNSSFKRRSLKLKKPTDRKNRPRSSTFAEDEEDFGFKRTDSIRSRRKVSGVSERSDTSERADISGEESPGVLSDEQPPESPVDLLESDDSCIMKNMPWLKVMVHVTSTLNFICPHQHFCHPHCYQRQIRACNRLVRAVRKVYGDDFGMVQDDLAKPQEEKEDTKKEKKLKKIITGPSSPLRRKASIAHNLDKLERSQDLPHFGAPRSLHSSTTFLAHEAVDNLSHGVEGKSEGKTADAGGSSRKKETKKKEENPTLKFVKTQSKSLFHSPLSTLVKGALVLPDEAFTDIMPVAWELLLGSDQQLTSAAAVMFILSAVKAPEQAADILSRELKHDEPSQRINAILRFQMLWKFRYQCWPRMEEGAHLVFKVPPPAIEFTLPSPKVALDSVPVADPPWMPQVKTKVEEVTINQDQSLQRSFVTATKTRRKQQIELIHRALQEEEEKKRTERENFHISSVPVCSQASYEPALFHVSDEHEEDEDQSTERNVTHHVQIAHALFPSCLCSAAVNIINLLDDAQVNPEGVAVYEVAYKVMWSCLVEDPALFLRHFLEKLTREKQDVIFQILRRMLRFIPRLPAQCAHTLYNYLIGFVMFYVRTPLEEGQELIGSALSILWLIIPSVQGLFLKDLKQILRKEQCDATLLITANVPSAKKVIIHGSDAGGIPSQFPIHEDTQFSLILQDSFDFFGIPEEQQNSYFLVDTRTNQMHNLNAFVRDFYFFKRSQYPQLSLVHMNPDEAFEKLQKQALTLRFVELGKVLMSLSIVKSQYLAIQRVLFLHEELMKLPAFPRKALEADFSLYTGTLGKEMLGMDTLHKIVWVRLVGRMFEVTSGFFAHSSDIHLFLNVISGALILHSEDAAVLRLCMATYINAAQQFKNIFAANGYLLIMPTILRIYSNHQTNGLLARTIEFVCKQFYVMHRKPFILQMFGSVAPILDMDTCSSYGDASKVHPKAFFQLLQSLGQYIVDPLDILELVEGEKPLRALDFCYQMDPDTLTMLDAISLCVTVVAYAADSQRGHQMLTILEAILPFYLRHLQTLTAKKETPGGSRTELQMIHNIAVCMKTLINNCEALARNYTGPQRAIDLRGSSIKNTSRGACSPPFEMDEDSHSKFVGDNYCNARKQQQYDREFEDSELLRMEFRRPRDTLLNVVAEFLTKCSARLSDLSKKVPDLHGKALELLDVKCHLRLAEVAHSLLKVSPYDPATMASRGLQRYMNEILPYSEWAQETMRPALIMVLRRLDKTFNKIAKKSAIRRLVDWNAARSLLKGVYLTLYRHPYIVHLPHLKSLVAVSQSIILGDQNNILSGESLTNIPSWAASLAQTPPPGFCSVVVRLVGMQMLALGDSQSLESVCGGSSLFTTPEKMEVYLINLILPLCIRISGGIKDVPKLRQSDISYALTVVLHALSPNVTKQGQMSNASKSAADPHGILSSKSNPHARNTLFQIGFLGLKILSVCFERQLATEWYRVARCVRELGNRLQGGLALWSFMDFVVTYRTPLFILLFPLIKQKMLQTVCENEQEYYYQQLIRDKLQGVNLPAARSRGNIFVSFVAELKALKEEIITKKIGCEMERRKSAVVESQSTTEGSRGISLSFLTGRRASIAEVTTDQNSSRTSNLPGANQQSNRPFLSRDQSLRGESHLPARRLSIHFSSHDGSRRVVQRFLRRTSYPEEEGVSSRGIFEEHTASSEPRLFRKSTLHGKKKGSRKSTTSVSADGVNEVTGHERRTDTHRDEGFAGHSTPSLSRPSSPGALHSPDYDEDSQRPRHRLQRQKAQSRKTFRFRKSRRGAGFLAGEATEANEEIAMAPPKKQPTLAEEGTMATSDQEGEEVPKVGFPIQKQKIIEESATTSFHKEELSRSPSPLHENAGDTYIVQGESTESLSNGENVALLRGDDRQKYGSRSSLLLIFPSKDDGNTCV